MHTHPDEFPELPADPAGELEDAREGLPLVLNYELDDYPLSPDAFRVYAHLVRRAQAKGHAWPSYRSIGAHCFGHVSDASPASLRRRAMRAVGELLEAGLVTRKGRALEDGAQTSNVYRLTPTRAWRSHPPGDTTVTPPVTPQSPPR